MPITNPRLTPADLDALEAAHKAATPGDVEICNRPIRDLRVQGVYEASSVQEATWKALFMREADAIAYRELHNVIPLLIAAARATVPERIGEKHRDGNWWLVLVRDYDGWQEAKWDATVGAWRNVYSSAIYGTPTHALPMPGAPDA